MQDKADSYLMLFFHWVACGSWCFCLYYSGNVCKINLLLLIWYFRNFTLENIKFHPPFWKIEYELEEILCFVIWSKVWNTNQQKSSSHSSESASYFTWSQHAITSRPTRSCWGGNKYFFCNDHWDTALHNHLLWRRKKNWDKRVKAIFVFLWLITCLVM